MLNRNGFQSRRNLDRRYGVYKDGSPRSGVFGDVVKQGSRGSRRKRKNPSKLVSGQQILASVKVSLKKREKEIVPASKIWKPIKLI